MLPLFQKLNDCYWFKKPILVLTLALSGIYGNLRSAESGSVNIKFHTEQFRYAYYTIPNVVTNQRKGIENKILISQIVNLHNIIKIFACAEQNSMLLKHTAGSIHKILIFTFCKILTIKIEIQKTPFYRFYFFLRF